MGNNFKLYRTKRAKPISKDKCPLFSDELHAKFSSIMEKEARLANLERHHQWPRANASEIYGTAIQILDTAYLNFVSRSYNKRYGLSGCKDVFESVGGHTNLAQAIFSAYYLYEYGPYQRMERYCEALEALRRHDLPEVITGDIPDAGERDESKKVAIERTYHKWYSKHSPPRNVDFEGRVFRLIAELEDKSTPLGRALYAADKASALIITLACDKLVFSPVMKWRSPIASDRDRIEMELCDFRIGHACYASEMWAIDYFKARELISCDETGFFTALIVMCTLLVNDGEWYSWRERDYS